MGVVLYEMVGGVPPFSGATPSDCIASILKTEPPPLSGVLSDVPVKLQSIVQKALRKNRDERYQTIKEMLTDLRDLKGELEVEGSSPQSKARVEPILTRINRHKRDALLTLAAAILLAAAFGYHFYFVAPAPVPNEKSIAVLPFADLSQARDQEYFCDGIQEEILTRLSKIRDLKVISRTSTQRFKSAPKNLPEIARQLGVATILEGTVQKAEGQVRVNVQLINARNDSHLWAEKYDSARLPYGQRRTLRHISYISKAHIFQTNAPDPIFELPSSISKTRSVGIRITHWRMPDWPMPMRFSPCTVVRVRKRLCHRRRRQPGKLSNWKTSCLKRTTHSACSWRCTTLISRSRKKSLNGPLN